MKPTLRAAVLSAILLLSTLAPAAALPQQAQASDPAWRHLDRYVAARMEALATPGVALAVTDRQRVLYVGAYGYSDLRARTPVTPDTLFQIGSISKSFTAAALLQLMEEGKFDPQAPVTRYLPWFQVQTEYEPITGHHLLTHTSGLHRDRDDIPSSLYQAAGVRYREAGYPPGRRWAYSNVGYQTLGYLLEAIAQQDYAAILRRRIFAPLGMDASLPVFTHADRPSIATGHVFLYDDRPGHPSQPIVPATWFEYAAGDGSLACTPADLAAYARMILNRGTADGGQRVLSPQSFTLWTARAARMDNSSDQKTSGHTAFYGYGLMNQHNAEGRTIVSHSGGMVGYSSMLLADMDSGLAVVVFVNGPGNPGQIADFALKTARAAAQGKPLPALDVPSPRRVPNAADYAGEFSGEAGAKLTFMAEGEALYLIHQGERIPLERRGQDRFLARHPDFDLFFLQFEREKGDERKEAEKEEKNDNAKPGPITEVTHGGRWFANTAYKGPRQFTLPAAWKGHIGHYRTTHPWFNNFRIVARKGKLWMAPPAGAGELLVELAPGLFQVGEEETAERIRFDAETAVNGQTLRVNLSGVDYYRTFRE